MKIITKTDRPKLYSNSVMDILIICITVFIRYLNTRTRLEVVIFVIIIT